MSDEPAIVGADRNTTPVNGPAEWDQEVWLRALIYTIPALVGYLDKELRYRFVNHAYQEWLGVPPAEIIGRTIEDVLGPEAFEQRRPYLTAALAGEAVRFEGPTRHFTRGVRVTEIAYTPYRIGDEVRGLFVLVHDVTDRTLADDALRASEARQRFLADLAATTQPLSDPDAVIAASARLLGEHLGADRCAYAVVRDESVFDVTGDYCRGVPSIVGRWPVAAFGAVVVRSMAANEPFVSDDVEADPRTGADLSAYRATNIRSVICVPLHKAGRFSAAMAVHQVTPRRWTPDEIELVRLVTGRCWESIERARVARELRESEERLRLAVEVAQMGTFAINLATDAVTVNETGRAIYGWPSVETNFSAVQTHFHPDDRDAVMRAVGAALDPSGPGTFEVEQRIFRTDGAERWIRVRGQAFFEGDGPARKAVRLLGTYRDFTERKQMEVALRDADRRKDEFLATLAHELRNPLAPVRNALAILQHAKGKPETAAKAVAVMDRQVAHMARLIDDLLDVSRVSRGKIQLRRRRVDIANVIRAAVETSGPAVERGDHKLTVSLPDSSLWVDADPDRLSQAVANVLNNAAKYTPRGGRITVTAARVDGCVAVRVRDNGVGIPADKLPKVWDLFAQVDQTLHRAQGGLGIGLSLVKSLVEMHGGRVEARSDGAGLGSEFTLRFPVMPDEARPERQGTGVTPPIVTPPPPRGLSVLVIEDNRDAAETMREVLELAGHVVTTVFDGPSGVEAARRIRPDVVVCDIGLPELDGYGVAAELRGDTRTASALLISVSGYGQEDDRRTAREAGFDHTLVKPVNPQALTRLILSRARNHHPRV